ncbi:MAG: glycosyltransferase family 2 protein [Candidatus Aenigmarchaeota archaeon]|nr:glycosyltransferase family 2 protein [Candidatus Aenigmarchaeota archaeon]
MRSLIIPAYNEEKRIGEVLEILLKNLSDYEIIVVNDGSKDKTEKIALSKGVKVISYKKNKGKGHAVKIGFLHANGDFIGFVDADKSIDPKYIKKVFDSLSQADIAIATRRNKKSKIVIQQPLIRRLASLIFNIFVVRIMFNLNISDSQCGCKAMKKEVAKYLAKKTISNGFEFDVEMLWKAKLKGYKIIEVPVIWKHEKNSTFNLLNGPKMFLSLIKIRFRGIR